MRISTRILLTLALLLIPFSLLGSVKKEIPIAQNGILDLRDWNFQKDGTVELYGHWQFYWKEFLSPSDTLLGKHPGFTGFMPIPGHWNNYLVDGNPISGEGYATFALIVRLPEDAENLALKLIDIQTAYRLFINKSELYNY